MSIALMTQAWKSTLPSGRKMVLLALCDNANDQGDCYPSISMLAEKCSMGERTVQQHITDLVKDGIVRRAMRGGRSTVYHIDPRRFCTPAKSVPSQDSRPDSIAPFQEGTQHATTPKSAADPRRFSTHAESAPPQNLHPTPANTAPLPPQISHPTPADFAPITVKEPSIEPSPKRERRSRIQKTALPEDWQLPKKLGEWALEESPHWSAEDVRKVADKFRDYWLSVGELRKDWDATWRNWCRNEGRSWTSKVSPARGYESEKDKARRAVAEAISRKGAGKYGRIIDIGSGSTSGSAALG